MKPKLTPVLVAILFVAFGITAARAEDKRSEPATKGGIFRFSDVFNGKKAVERDREGTRQGGAAQVDSNMRSIDLKNEQVDDVVDAGTAASDKITPPTVLSVTPPKGFIVGVDDPITITFSKKMDLDSVKDSLSLWGWYFIPKKITTKIQAVGESGKKFRIFPWETLVPKVLYVIKVKKGVEDLFKQPLAEGFSSDFYVNEFGGCPKPKITLEVPQHSCTYHVVDDSAEDDWVYPCFKPGHIAVPYGSYKVVWKTENVVWVEEDCHGFLEDTEFEYDSGSWSFPWDGPRVGEFWPKGYSNSLSVQPNKPKEIPNDTCKRMAGRFDCDVIAHGACGKAVSTKYWYACP